LVINVLGVSAKKNLARGYAKSKAHIILPHQKNLPP
jgi:hypothetical protein